MRKLVSMIVIIILSVSASAQVTWNAESSSATLEGVIQVDTLSSAVQYDRAKIWIASNLKSSDNQIIYDDVDKSKIIVSGYILLKNKANFGYPIKNRFVSFKLSLFFKDGRFKYIINNIILTETYVFSDGEQIRTFSMDELYQKQSEKKNPKKMDMQVEIDEVLIGMINALSNSITSITELESNQW